MTQKTHIENAFHLSSSGGIPLRILMVSLSFLVIASVLFYFLENQKKNNRIDHRKAIELSDYGFQRVMEDGLETITTDPEGLSGIPRSEYNGGWYTVNVSTARTGDTLVLTIESEGVRGKQSARQKKNIVLHRVLDGNDWVWRPANIQ